MTMMATDNDLTELHNAWLAQYDEMAKRDGVEPDDVAESCLTICVVSMMKLHGPRHVAARLAIVAGMLTAVADNAALEGHSDDKNRCRQPKDTVPSLHSDDTMVRRTISTVDHEWSTPLESLPRRP